ncbi:MAG TPA: glucose-6-phosphate isomerase [Candidatus Polarisedimenticolia bacterium]|nr:glucose-6-phosphate isomerase [Candidatus Polarisedimenticolia bacterium]
MLKLGRNAATVDAAVAMLQKQGFIRRLLARDPTLWKDDAHHAEIVRNRMGWLDAPGRMLDRTAELMRFAEAVRKDRIRHVVLLGMGGSSLCPDVLRRTFRRRPGFPALLVLDSTDPEAIGAVDRVIDRRRSLFIVASKSGTTIESQMLYQYYREKSPAARFVAITDPGTPLEETARREAFREVFVNPPDIGGRYSAHSYFGMVPAACMGLDVTRLLERGESVMRSLRSGISAADCHPVFLGAALGALGRVGRDKVTFVAPRRIAAFGYWVEQLIAESTGKEGTGLVPVEGETLGPPARYGKDRVFIHLRLRGAPDAAERRRLSDLARAGHPVLSVDLQDLYDLGAEFSRWEIATAAAGSVLGIDPFDEPNVKESKDNTARVLEQYRTTGALPATEPVLTDPIRVWTTIDLPAPPRRGREDSLRLLLAGLCRSVRKGDYIAIMAYLKGDAPTTGRLHRLRMKLRDRCRAATTVGFGPRFLHSTGQLHKGGAGNGVFLQITGDKSIDLRIPGEPFSFGVLQAAQAAGDFISLAARGYRVVRVHLGPKRQQDLDRLIASL